MCPIAKDDRGNRKCGCSVSTPDVFRGKQTSSVTFTASPSPNVSAKTQNGTVTADNSNSAHGRQSLPPKRRKFSPQPIPVSSESCTELGHETQTIEPCSVNGSNKVSEHADLGIQATNEPYEQDLKVIEKLLEIEADCLSDTSANSTDSDEEDDD